jgi:hypothetical protein
MRVGYELRSLGLLAKEKAPVSVYNETKIVVTQRALGKRARRIPGLPYRQPIDRDCRIYEEEETPYTPSVDNSADLPAFYQLTSCSRSGVNRRRR